jgi:hypothetical protein
MQSTFAKENTSFRTIALGDVHRLINANNLQISFPIRSQIVPSNSTSFCKISNCLARKARFFSRFCTRTTTTAQRTSSHHRCQVGAGILNLPMNIFNRVHTIIQHCTSIQRAAITISQCVPKHLYYSQSWSLRRKLSPSHLG